MSHQIFFSKISKNATRLLITLGLLWSGSGMRAMARAPQSDAGGAEFFKTQILPILAARCQSCHNHALKLSGLDLESSAGMKAGGAHGPVVMAGNAQQSRLYRRGARAEKTCTPLGGGGRP